MSRLHVWLSILAGLCLGLAETTNDNSTRGMRIVSLEEGFVTIYYGIEPTPSTVLLYADKDLGNFSISLESVKTDIATVSEEVAISPCQKEEHFNITSNVTYLTTYQYNYTSMEKMETCYNLSFTGTAVYIGYSTLKFYVQFDNSSVDVYVDEIILRCIRYQGALYTVYLVSIFVLVVIIELAMGNDIDFATIKKHLKTPKAPIIAMIAQYTINPLVAYSIIWIMGYTGGKALGFFALGCSPGGGSSNMYSKLFNGDMSLSVTMTTLSTIACLGMLPLWIYTLGATIPADEGLEKIKIPFVGILRSLAAIVIPLAIGALIKYKLPRVSRVIHKWLTVVFVLVIVFFCTFGIYINFYIFAAWDGELTLAACALPYVGFILGGLFAWICRLDWKLIKTISLETGMQNVGVCILVVQSIASNPDSDLAIILPAASTLVASWPFFIILPIYLLRQRIINKRKAKLQEEEVSETSKVGDELEMETMEKERSGSNESDDRNCVVESRVTDRLMKS
ncbi:ileal sodium/bile acid cotransporter-like [Watersipora subatra]|uniref:ileal sodium/bile acid cotransporter-like n=1 Tax=Watersipora subatra TaxID=2589382 RepID=UPI00355B68DF